MAAYGDQLMKGANVRYHGYLDPMEQSFMEIIDRCSAFIAPSCSEGVSAAAATMMRAGLFPIVSRDTGITLPQGEGIYLETCHIDEIIEACRNVDSRSDMRLLQSILVCQSYGLRRYSRESFACDMNAYLRKALGKVSSCCEPSDDRPGSFVHSPEYGDLTCQVPFSNPQDATM